MLGIFCLFFFFSIYLQSVRGLQELSERIFSFFFWLHWVWVEAPRIFNLPCSMQEFSLQHLAGGSSSLTRDGTRAPCTESAESQRLDH